MKRIVVFLVTFSTLFVFLATSVFASTPFTDVKADSWYSGAVDFCYQNGYMSGISDTKFSPNTQVTRAMFAVILSKIDDADLSTYTRSSFEDVKEGKWYSSAIEWLYLNDITTGVTETKFGVNNFVTREQICVFLKKYVEYLGADTSQRANLNSFSDSNQIHSWAKDAVSWTVACGYLSGNNGKVSPRNSATRAQIAVIIKSFVEKKGA